MKTQGNEIQPGPGGDDFDLPRTLRLLETVGATDTSTPRNLAADALGRLRRRGAAIGNVNEVLAAIGSALRGIGVMLSRGGDRPPDRG